MAKTQSKTKKEFVQPNDSFTGELDGEVLTFTPRDVVAADHPAVKRWPHHFKSLESNRQRPEVEEMTAEPGKKRGA